jgi:uncharacterized protein (TIGR02246 family)
MNITEDNKRILEMANAAVSQGDNEGFLSFCTDDTKWTFVGEQTLNGKEAVREYMKKAYLEPPKFMVEHLIAEGNFVTAVGTIRIKDEQGTSVKYSYCDVWKLLNGKLHELRAFVINDET